MKDDSVLKGLASFEAFGLPAGVWDALSTPLSPHDSSRVDVSGGTDVHARTRRSDEYNEVEEGVTRSFVEKILSNVTIFYSPDTPEVRRVIQSANATIDAVATLLQLFECAADLQCRLANNTASVCRDRTRGTTGAPSSSPNTPFGINLNVW